MVTLDRNASVLQNAYVAAQISWLTSHPGADKAFEILGLENRVNLKTISGFIVRQDENLIVAFRGTRDWVDILTDLQARMVPAVIGPGYAHEGFQRALMGGLDEVKKVIQSFEKEARRLWIVGHSMGGAVAALAAQQLRLNELPGYVYTFGMPKTFDSIAAGAYYLPVYRFTNLLDPIPKVPLKSEGRHYVHIGTQYRLPTNWKASLQFLPEWVRSRWKWVTYGYKMSLIHTLWAHPSNVYVKNLAQELGIDSAI